MKLSEIAEKFNLKYYGDGNININKISSPENADENSICLIWDENIIRNLNNKIPVVMPEKYFNGNKFNGIVHENPREFLAELSEIFTEHHKLSGVHPKACIEPGAIVHPSAYIGACAYVGKNCVIGENSIIEPGAVLFFNVRVGKNCLIHSGAVIGCDGFGFARTPEGLIKIPQNGGVKIGDNIEIGACTTIDRGTLNDTEINSGTKIDNHVQIGHNVKIGKNCIICSMTGIAGSSTIEDNVTISVQAGITDHVRVGANTIIAGRSGVTNDIEKNSVVSGFPARNHNDAKRALMLATRLPEFFKRLRELEKKFK